MVRNRFPTLPAQCFVEYGNYIGDTLKIAQQLQFAQVCLVMMMGKAVKLAAGHLDTHSKRCTMDKDFIAKMLAEAGCDENVCRRALQMTLARTMDYRARRPPTGFYRCVDWLLLSGVSSVVAQWTVGDHYIE